MNLQNGFRAYFQNMASQFLVIQLSHILAIVDSFHRFLFVYIVFLSRSPLFSLIRSLRVYQSCAISHFRTL